ncbi:MAG: hypothetical protein ABID38_04605 [Candidatus Diapherotrites archaeon]
MLNRKGFIGPIGDDLPSLIPLIFALIIFFSTFSFALARYGQMTASFENDLTVANISGILRGDSFITGPDDFSKKCGTLPVTKMKYVAGLTNAMTAPEYFKLGLSNPIVDYQGIDVYNLKFVNDNVDEDDELDPVGYNNRDDNGNAEDDNDGDGNIDSEYRCANVDKDEELTFEGSRYRDVVYRIYPIALQQNKVVRPMHLVVVAWAE